MSSRAVIVGSSHPDANHYRGHREIVEAEVTLVSANALPLTIKGSVGGMNLNTVYVTPTAESRGVNYDVAMTALQRCLDRTGGSVVHLTSHDL